MFKLREPGKGKSWSFLLRAGPHPGSIANTFFGEVEKKGNKKERTAA